MIEPPVAGFTGVIWEARPTEKLAHDLGAGAGARPMADAGAAWSRVAAAFGAAVIEYDRVLVQLRESWRSSESEIAIDRFAALRHWLIDAATAAGRHAAMAGGQAVAYEVASLAMPHLADLAALDAAVRSIEQMGAALGTPLVGAIAEVDTEQNLAKANAARVMQNYESASAQLASPWEPHDPPQIVSGSALATEQAAAADPGAVSSAPAAGLPPALGGVGAAFGAPRVPRAVSPYQIRAFGPAAAVEPEAVPVQSSPAAAHSGAGQMMPGSLGAGAAAGAGPDRTIRSGLAETEAGEVMEIDAGMQVAPPVLGGVGPGASGGAGAEAS
ncbi:PPE domain-containing protein [Nocardia sp. NPDC050193]